MRASPIENPVEICGVHMSYLRVEDDRWNQRLSKLAKEAGAAHTKMLKETPNFDKTLKEMRYLVDNSTLIQIEQQVKRNPDVADRLRGIASSLAASITIPE